MTKQKTDTLQFSFRLKYYGLERDLEGKGEWFKCGIIGASSDILYADIRKALGILENFRVRPIEDKSLWADIFKMGKIIDLKLYVLLSKFYVPSNLHRRLDSTRIHRLCSHDNGRSS